MSLRERLRCVGERPHGTGWRRCQRLVRTNSEPLTLVEAMAGGPRYCDLCTDEILRADHELYRAATGEIQHAYTGGCPDAEEPGDRDPECPVCRALSPHLNPNEGDA